MSTICEGSVVTICVAVKTTGGMIEAAAGTVIWASQGKLGVLLPCGTIWYGGMSQVFPAQAIS